MAVAPKFIRKKIVSPIKDFIADSRATGIVLIVCTVFSLTMSNFFVGNRYVVFWQEKLFATPFHFLPESILHIINEGLMTFFFFLVGLEIKRELVIGELSQPKKAILPIIAAIGGMIVPALIYLSFCSDSTLANGWGIPIATDIAFSLAVLSLLGKRVPVSLKIFLMALAIIDDLGGIFTIAVFYASVINWLYVLGSFIVVVLLFFFKKRINISFFLFAGILLWFFLFNSGIHATISGVVIALFIPLSKIEQLEHQLHFPVNFTILPLFVLANTAMIFPDDFSMLFQSEIAWGIFFGLVVGKPLGIVVFSWLSVRFKLAILPQGTNWKQIIGVGIVAGIGFTVSMFISTLAFQENNLQTISKMAVLIASIVAALFGYVFVKKHQSV